MGETEDRALYDLAPLLKCINFIYIFDRNRKEKGT